MLWHFELAKDSFLWGMLNMIVVSRKQVHLKNMHEWMSDWVFGNVPLGAF